MTCQLLIDLVALELLMCQPPARKRKFVEHLHRLRLYPAASSDYRDTDAHGRLVHVPILDGFAIYYWIDEADRHVKILEIATADKGRPPPA